MRRWAALLIGAIALFCCVDCGSEASPVTFASYERGYEATAPGGWKRVPEEEAGETDLLLESPEGAAVFMIYDEPKADYNLTAEEYFDIVLNMTAHDMNTLPEEKVELREIAPLTVNGGEAPGYRFNFTDESGLNMVFQLYFFETEDAYVRINASAKVSAFEEYQPILKEIVESILVR